MTDAAGLYRVTAGSNHTVAAPAPDGRLERLGDAVLLWGPAGTWVRRDDLDGSWRRVAEGPLRVVPTGDPGHPALLVFADRLELADAAGHPVPIPFPHPASQVISALLTQGRLLVGTSGLGLLWTDLAPSEGP